MGHSGWSNDQPNSLTLPPGAGPTDARIIIGDDIPAELQTFYGGDVQAALLFYSDADHYSYIAVTTPAFGTLTCIGARDAGGITEHVEYGASAGAAVWEMGLRGAYPLTFQAIANSFNVLSDDFEVLNTDNSGVINDVGSGIGSLSSIVGGTIETWHGLTLVNGWTNRALHTPLSYRKVAAPSTSIQLVGQIVPGTLVDGTTVSTLPTGYRPTHEIVIDARKGAGTRAILTANSSGALSVFDAAGSTLLQIIPAIIPLDI